jgi:hypothetical protein
MIREVGDITSFRWATVTAVSPLAIQLDGDTASLAVSPDTLLNGLEIGDRVRVELSYRKAVIHGRVKASPAPFVSPVGLVRRTTTALSTGSSVYADMSANAAWGYADLSGGVTYSNGFIIPLAGMYRVEWQLLTVGSSVGIVGIGVNQVSAPSGDMLHAADALQNGGAVFGSGTAMVRLAAGDKLTLWGFGNGAAIAINNLANRAPHWGLQWIES